MVFDSETSKKCNLKLSKDYKSNRIDYSIITEEENPFSELPMMKLMIILYLLFIKKKNMNLLLFLQILTFFNYLMEILMFTCQEENKVYCME